MEFQVVLLLVGLNFAIFGNAEGVW